MAYTRKYAPEKTTLENRVVIENGIPVEVKEFVVHRFLVGDAEDPDLYAAHPLSEWEDSESGKWVMEHAVGAPTWHRSVDYQTFGYVYIITAKLKGPDITYYSLKWGAK